MTLTVLASFLEQDKTPFSSAPAVSDCSQSITCRAAQLRTRQASAEPGLSTLQVALGTRRPSSWHFLFSFQDSDGFS